MKHLIIKMISVAEIVPTAFTFMKKKKKAKEMGERKSIREA